VSTFSGQLFSKSLFAGLQPAASSENTTKSDLDTKPAGYKIPMSQLGFLKPDAKKAEDAIA